MSQEKLCKSLLEKGFNKSSAIKISKKKYALSPNPIKPIDESVFTGKEDNSEYIDNLNSKAADRVGKESRIDKQLKEGSENPSKNEAGLTAEAPAQPPAQPNYDIHTSIAEKDEQGHRIKRKTITEYDMGEQL